MKKICIVTLNGNNNYGNRLQSFALQFYLKNNFNVDVVTLWKTNLFEFSKKLLKEKILCIKKCKRERNISDFTRKYINIKYVTKIPSNYDYYIVGSDQVWNYNYTSFSDYYLLNNKYIKNKISYSASIGLDSLNGFKNIFSDNLKTFKSISVRETTAKIILDRLNINKNVDVLVDPTLLIEKNNWVNISNKSSLQISEKYILCYYLGDEMNSDLIEKYALKNNFSIINLLDINSKFYYSKVEDFLYLIKNAEMIFTDSFHACVFSFIFDKSFLVFKRSGEENNTYSRIKDFLDKFEINNRVLYDNSISSVNVNHNYLLGYEILKNERKKSKLFLEKSLDIDS